MKDSEFERAYAEALNTLDEALLILGYELNRTQRELTRIITVTKKAQ